MEEEGRRRGDSKTRPRSVSYRRKVSCTGAGGFPTGSSPPLQRDTEKRFFFSPTQITTSENCKSSSSRS